MILTSLRRRGLTLIELTVVLLVLAAVAGIIVPRLTGYFVRAHGASGATNIGETVKAIGLYEVNNGGNMPNNWDTFVINPTTTTIVGDMGLTGGDLAAINVPTAGEDALIAAGITNLLYVDNDGTNFNGPDATYTPYATPTPVAINNDATPTAMAGLTASGIQALGLQGVAGDYVVLGLGSQNTLIGNGIVDAPVHFPETSAVPQEIYSRFLAVFRLSDDGGTTYFERAKLATVAAVHNGEVAGLGDHTAEYFEGAEQASAN
ncbi:MAG: prepilin-type N-terminal cleavage/methylation domain-containing protein [Planctomycetota bacterium]